MPTTLYYIHDPMCSWCYAFQATLTRLEKQLPAAITLTKVVGGLAPDSQQPMPAAMQKFIQNTWRKIEQTVPEIQFNFNFWTNNTPIRSTYPACRAILAAKRQGQQFEDNMISAIQSAYYQQAQNPSLPETLVNCAAICGLDSTQFSEDLCSRLIQQQLTEQLQLANSLAVTSFPSLRLTKQKQIFEIKIDYLNQQTMLNEITEISNP